MKLLTTITLGLLTTVTLNAQTTMCFKENHTSMMTIETTVLDGGLCSSQKNVQNMKKEGWSVDDIKIEKSSNGNNYIYIFKKDELLLSSLDEEKLEQRIMQKLETRKQEEIQLRKIAIKQKMSKNGKRIYIDTCQQCHGEKAEKRPYNTSRPLMDLNYTDFELSIRGYTNDDYDRGYAILMKPYANMLTTKKIKDIYTYIQTLKPQSEATEKKEESK